MSAFAVLNEIVAKLEAARTVRTDGANEWRVRSMRNLVTPQGVVSRKFFGTLIARKGARIGVFL